VLKAPGRESAVLRRRREKEVVAAAAERIGLVGESRAMVDLGLSKQSSMGLFAPGPGLSVKTMMMMIGPCQSFLFLIKKSFLV
jgi:hypothetical protein